MVVCAAYVCDCSLEHEWTETWEDRNQYHIEPVKPLFGPEGGEMGTDDAEGPIHYKISHSRLKIKDLPN